MMYSVTLVLALAAGASCMPQFFPQGELSIAIQPPPLQQSTFNQQAVFPQQQQLTLRQQPQQPQQQQASYAHRAVVANAQREAQLPPHMLNPFYKNQRIATALAKESWFTPGENLVVDREAEKIPRDRIYTVLKNAGLVNRRR